MIKWANLWNYHSIYKQLKLALNWNKRYTLWSWCKSTCIILVWIWTCRRHDIIDIDCTAYYTIQINLTQFSYTHSMFGSTHTIIEVCFSIIKNILTLIWGVLVCPVAKWQDGNQQIVRQNENGSAAINLLLYFCHYVGQGMDVAKINVNFIAIIII